MFPKRLTLPIRISFAIALAGLGALLILLFIQPPTPPAPPAYNNQISIGGAFVLRDHHNNRVTQADFIGNYMLIYFGFTYCPDVCPTSLQIMASALDELEKTAPQKAARITPLLVSVDPQRDTPSALANYVAAFHPRLIGLTGTQAQIDTMLRAYKVYAAKVADDTSTAAYTIDHSSFFYLMGPDGKFIRHFDHNTSPEKMARLLAKFIN